MMATAIRKDELQASVNKYFPFLMEIRKRILLTGSIFIIFGVIGFSYYERIIRLSLKILDIEGVNLVFTSPFQFVNLAISSGLVLATIATFPFVVAQILSFLRPGLRRSEYRTIVGLLPFSIILFAMGFGFGIATMKYVVGLFYEKSLELEIGNFLDISNFLSKILVTSTLMGVAFQYPVVLTILTKLGIVSHQTLKRQRVFVYTASLIFAAFLPPTDLLSLALLTLPLVILFETTLILTKLVKPEKR